MTLPDFHAALSATPERQRSSATTPARRVMRLTGRVRSMPLNLVDAAVGRPHAVGAAVARSGGSAHFAVAANGVEERGTGNNAATDRDRDWPPLIPGPWGWRRTARTWAGLRTPRGVGDPGRRQAVSGRGGWRRSPHAAAPSADGEVGPLTSERLSRSVAGRDDRIEAVPLQDHLPRFEH